MNYAKKQLKAFIDGEPASGKDAILLEILLRITALENILLRSGAINEDDLVAEIQAVRDKVIETVNQDPDLLLTPKVPPTPDRSKN